MSDGVTIFRDVRAFDGERVLPRTSVLVRDSVIAKVGEEIAVDSDAVDHVVDVQGATLLPGLIDAHTHVMHGSLEQALRFGVTTELDMFADPSVVTELRAKAAIRDDLADLRSAGTCATAGGGHPTGLVDRGLYPPFPTIDDPAEAGRFVADRVAESSDYLKIIVDDGCCLGYPRPTLSAEAVSALVAAAHDNGLLAIVHTLDRGAARLALEAGADALAHLVVDGAPDPELATLAADTGAFAVPTLVVLEAICGQGNGPTQVTDPRFAAHLDDTSRMMLTMAGGNFPLGPNATVDITAAPKAIGELSRAGVPILAGSDAGTLGVAHGASLHRELELLVATGLSAVEALTAATSAPADRFGLTDRGRIQPGTTADLLLVDGDPTADITATADIRGIWRRGTRLDRT